MTKDTARRGRETAQVGQSLTEFSIVVVLFLVLLFGIVDAGRLIYAYNVVSASAREGVRWAVVRGSTSGRAASASDIQAYVQSKTVGVAIDPPEVTWGAGGNAPGSFVKIKVQSHFAPIAPFPFVPSTITLTSESRMVISR
jgi:Flp pilus assembly protein TadG